jgi:hypothetical protein
MCIGLHREESGDELGHEYTHLHAKNGKGGEESCGRNKVEAGIRSFPF